MNPPHAKSLGLKVSQFGEKIWLEQRLNVTPWHKFKSDELARLLRPEKLEPQCDPIFGLSLWEYLQEKSKG